MDLPRFGAAEARGDLNQDQHGFSPHRIAFTDGLAVSDCHRAVQTDTLASMFSSSDLSATTETIDQTLDSRLEARTRPLATGPTCRALIATIGRVLFGGLPLLLLLTTGCASTKLFQSNFDTTPINQPPAQKQAVGTATTGGSRGSVLVASLPDTPAIRGVRFDPTGREGYTALYCQLTEHPDDGTYVFSTLLYIPSKSGGFVAINFERVPGIISPVKPAKVRHLQAVGGAPGDGEWFMHLDFLGDSVTIDNDPSTKFGKFPRDQVFIVQVTLNFKGPRSAHIVLSGAGASGEAHRNLSSGPPQIAQRFGAVRIWTFRTADIQMFYAANIAVTRKD